MTYEQTDQQQPRQRRLTFYYPTFQVEHDKGFDMDVDDFPYDADYWEYDD